MKISAILLLLTVVCIVVPLGIKYRSSETIQPIYSQIFLQEFVKSLVLPISGEEILNDTTSVQHFLWAVGRIEGSDDGTKVGVTDAIKVGYTDGVTEGIRLGSKDGDDVGINEGIKLFVGTEEGSKLGVTLGIIDGIEDFVGNNDGTNVDG